MVYRIIFSHGSLTLGSLSANYHLRNPGIRRQAGSGGKAVPDLLCCA